jgi:superfamily I DNA/RNA helicase
MIVLASNSLIGNSGKGEAVSSAPGKIYRSVFASEKTEAIFIAHKISEMIGGRLMSESHEMKQSDHVYGFNDIAILVRTNHQMKMIQECLTTEGIPFRKKGSSFMDEVSIQVLVALLKLMLHPEERLSEERLELLGFAKESTGLLAEKEKYVVDVVSLIDQLARSFDPAPLEEAKAIASENNSANQFLETLLLSRDTEIETSSGHLPAEAVSLLTMHAVKGLEFEIVFIPGCEEGIIPIRPEEEEEERRLFYVAISRAKEELFLLGSEKRRRSGELIKTEPSRFLTDLDVPMSETVEPRRKKLNLQPSLFK